MFNKTHYQDLKNKLALDYKDFVLDFRSQLDEISKIQLFSDSFVNELNKIVVSPKVSSFSPKNFYWIQLINDLLLLIELIDEEDEESLFDFFTDSEYATEFMEEIKSNSSIDIAINFIEKYEDQIISYYKIHLDHQLSQGMKSQYTMIPEIGDNQFIHLTDASIRLNFSINLHEIKKESDYKYDKISNFYFVPRDNFDELILKNQKDNISLAISRLKKYSPFCMEALEEFTNVVIPINESGVVSYSIQELPGYSLINMFDRDEIDLMDDLIHENGHHYLNYHLNQQELILEDDELIFYSPWRDSKRTIRGLYHAYLTFLWAYKLYGDLSLATIDSDEFSKAQKAKFYARFKEEEVMLAKAQEELMKASEMNKITDKGLELIEEFENAFFFEQSDLSKIHSLC